MKIIDVDVDKCTACRSCEFACSVKNLGESNPSRANIHIVRSESEGRITAIPVVCQQCVDALCVRLCPARALVRHPQTNAVVVNAERCLGCRTCVEVCPYGAPSVDPRSGVSQKCTLCDGDPTCVKFCPNGALSFVEDDEASVRRKRSSVERYLRELDATAT
jgi:anaerobic carbon-monoxide dehydrogenase iron sulfur subunit